MKFTVPRAIGVLLLGGLVVGAIQVAFGYDEPLGPASLGFLALFSVAFGIWAKQGRKVRESSDGEHSS